MAWPDEQKIATTQIARGVDQTVQPVVGDILVATASGYVQYALAVPAAGVINALAVANGETTPTWQPVAVVGADYLVGTANTGLTNEIVVGTTPNGELGGTWGAITVDTTHSGSAHHAAVTVTDDTTLDFTLTGQDVTAVVIGMKETGGTKLTAGAITDGEFLKRVGTTIVSAAGASGAPTDADYLVGTANGGLSNEIVVGTTPGGELGGTWANPTVDTTHSGSAHHSAVTLAADADVLLGLSGQEIGFDTQTANTVLAGPTTGAAADPTFRGLVAADIPTHVVDVPVFVSGDTISSGFHAFLDEDAAKRIKIRIAPQANWVAATNITIDVWWYSNATGAASLDYALQYFVDSDESSIVDIVSAWAAANLTWSVANTLKKSSFTIAAANIATNRMFELTYRRNTGDANTGICYLRGVRAQVTLSH